MSWKQKITELACLAYHDEKTEMRLTWEIKQISLDRTSGVSCPKWNAENTAVKSIFIKPPLFCCNRLCPRFSHRKHKKSLCAGYYISHCWCSVWIFFILYIEEKSRMRSAIYLLDSNEVTNRDVWDRFIWKKPLVSITSRDLGNVSNRLHSQISEIWIFLIKFNSWKRGMKG